MIKHLFLFLLAQASCALFAEQPNILWIVTDDQRGDSLACVDQVIHRKYDSPLSFVNSPEIDMLAIPASLIPK